MAGNTPFLPLSFCQFPPIHVVFYTHAHILSHHSSSCTNVSSMYKSCWVRFQHAGCFSLNHSPHFHASHQLFCNSAVPDHSIHSLAFILHLLPLSPYTSVLNFPGYSSSTQFIRWSLYSYHPQHHFSVQEVAADLFCPIKLPPFLDKIPASCNLTTTNTTRRYWKKEQQGNVWVQTTENDA